MMNIKESHYQNELINKFQDKGWKRLEKNNSNSQLEYFNISEMRNYLKKRYSNLENNEDEINEILNIIKSRIDSNDWLQNNINGISLIKEGISTTYTKNNGIRPYMLIDFNEKTNNLFSIQEEVWISYNSRLDVVMYINGMPVYIWELKSFKYDKKNLINQAIDQIQKYTNLDNPKVMSFNLGLLVSQTIDSTLIGSPSTKRDFWFKPISDSGNIDSLIDFFSFEKMTNLFKWGVLFKSYKGEKTKVILRPHQYEAIKLINDKISAREGGYVWHTQGSGKTITISALVSSLSHFKKNASFTVVIDVDRTELVDNIFETLKSFKETNIFTNIHKAKSSEDLKKYLSKSEYRGVIVTTTQKFSDWGKLSNRDDILLISDEAHRTHSNDLLIGEDNKTYLEKITTALPNSVKIGFTGTPIFGNEKSTYEQFGEMIHKYTMKDAEEDGIITKIKFSFAEIKLKLNEDNFDGNFTGNEINSSRVKNESLERNEAISNEISKSFIANKSNHLNNGYKDTYKAMVVTSSIKQGWILFNLLKKKLKNIDIKFVGTASNDKDRQSEEIFNFLSDANSQSKWISEFKDDKSKIEIMVVTDKLLTGYDVPNLRIMYLDKEIKSHNLLQTIARVNRKYDNKDNGYVISFRNIQKELIDALNTYRDTTGDNSDLINHVRSSDHLFDKDIEVIEKYINLTPISDGLAMYINGLAYDVKQMPEFEQTEILNALDGIYSTYQIVYKIDTDVKKFKVRTLLFLRSILKKNEENESIIKLSDEEFQRILNSVEVDGETTYTMSEMDLNEIMELKQFLPEKILIKKISKEAEREIRKKSNSKDQEEKLLDKLRRIIENYNDDLESMKDLIREINSMQSVIDLLNEPSKWTKYLIDILKREIGEISLNQAEYLDSELKSSSIDEWYSTEGSMRTFRMNVKNVLNDKAYFENLDDSKIIDIIEIFIETTRTERGN